MKDQSSQVFLQRARVMNLIRIMAFVCFIIALFYSLAAVVYSTKVIYKVKLNYAVILEQFGGKRKAVTDLGWHYRLPFFTRLEKDVPLMNQNLYLGGSSAPIKIISRENVALWTSALMTFKIKDLKVWGIENLFPEILLQGDFDGIAKDTLQAQEVNKLISEREKIKEIIFQALKNRPINKNGPTIEGKYGIEVVSFVINETRFGDKLVEATEEKKRRQLIAEADNYAADQEADRIKKLYKAYLEGIRSLHAALGGSDKQSVNPALFEFLSQQKWATAYEKNQSEQKTFVLHGQGQAPSLTLPSMFEKRGNVPIKDSKKNMPAPTE
ncbi:SPFH domain-containing protein [Desulfobacula phenolica]|uniref:Regulator of protease activity HflC, stomatin/prohibitin superfamily n=1 Tax=Desulfobacula phenolica TaxID=90732 RepID=A0A1H2J0E2_9BACT|nr:SPFH domain-containing protein [Desulfobacula phenolica]SDU49528.1 Regulator of protease activity HflC, stomatin/prohibitin superfamily [Desulfobacula phenolica]